MFTQYYPQRVAILWSGAHGSATLREVLKHNTVEEVYLIGIDPESANIANDCSNIQSPTGSRYCLNDPRTRIVSDDAVEWFKSGYADARDDDDEEDSSDDEDSDNDKHDKPLFDVIILDAL